MSILLGVYGHSMPAWTEAPLQTLHKPRLLCLHGGGTNAEIFRLQCRGLILSLTSQFRLVFANAPYLTAPHPAIVQVYGDLKPFRRWVAWTSSHEMPLDDQTVIDDIKESLKAAMSADDKTGADGPWVGLLGFSQGAKMVASILFEQQLTAAQHAEPLPADAYYLGQHWKFGICMAGSGPLVAFGPKGLERDFVDKPSRPTKLDWEGGYLPEKLSIPTVHVHGLSDPGVKQHRLLYYEICKEGSAKLIEWDGDHRLPFRGDDVKKVVDAISKVAQSVGVTEQE